MQFIVLKIASVCDCTVIVCVCVPFPLRSQSDDAPAATEFFKLVHPRPYGKQVWQQEAGAESSFAYEDSAIATVQVERLDIVRGEAMVSLCSDVLPRHLGEAGAVGDTFGSCPHV